MENLLITSNWWINWFWSSDLCEYIAKFGEDSVDLAQLLLGEMKARLPSMSEERAKARLRRLVRRVTYNQEEEEERNPEGAAKASDKVGLKPITMF